MRERKQGNTYSHSGMLDGGAGVLGGERDAHEGATRPGGSTVLGEDGDGGGTGAEDVGLDGLAVTRADIDDKAG